MTFFNLHTHTSTNDPNTVELVNQYPWEFKNSISNYSIGIHPWYIDLDRLQSDFEVMRTKITDFHCLAVGECGLDKRIEIPLQLQQSVFDQQLLLAQEYQKPVVIHCVAAFDELIATKKRLKITVPIVIHGFSKSKQLAKQLIDNGFYLSFGKNLLQNPEMESVFLSIPEDRYFLETDTIAEHLVEVYALAAKYKNGTVAVIQQTIHNNFEQVFKTSLDTK
ncbi:TatD family hydrolase [Flavobacterium sp. 7A]|uniref:TatD family hydrolase n=1 Tax=Flavobacterium sp. 7A TaxID=2940571 RepID=UPI0022268D92|nr:TatD family hydrolase [Flavobacterium sp. 7A]MCW2120790.1 TatD DNase family protein [Flavobacterium sp. 7A]